MRDADLKDLSIFLAELQEETDRGLALVAASVLDDKLRAVLAAFFVENSAARRLLDTQNAPLGTFSARADACFALGLIDDFEHQEITLVRRVRNEFAHGLHGTHFQTEPIRGYCSSLKSNMPDGVGHPTNEARFRFTNAVVSLVNRLYYRSEWVERERRAPKEWVSTDQVRWRSFAEEKPPADTPVLRLFKNSLDPSAT